MYIHMYIYIYIYTHTHIYMHIMQNDTAQSQDVLILSESFGILLAANLDIDGSVESDNIGMNMQLVNFQKTMVLLTEIATTLVSASSREDISFFNSTIENSILIPEMFISDRSLITGMHMCCILLCCIDF